MSAQLKLNFSPAEREQVKRGAYGELSKRDLREFNEAQQRVFSLLKDGRWHTAEEVIRASKQREGLKRLRELRLKGCVIESEPQALSRREWKYRLKLRQETV